MKSSARTVPSEMCETAILHFAKVYSSLMHTYIHTYVHTYTHTIEIFNLILIHMLYDELTKSIAAC